MIFRAAAALPVKLLMKSAKVGGFFLFHYAPEWKKSFKEMSELYENGEIKCTVDYGKTYKPNGFQGIDDIPSAVEYLYTKKSIGKIVVCLGNENQTSKL